MGRASCLKKSAYKANRLVQEEEAPKRGLVGAKAGKLREPSKITTSRPSLLWHGCHVPQKGRRPKPMPGTSDRYGTGE
jgi:hypothetical protein